jgi:hypothetical protein
MATATPDTKKAFWEAKNTTFSEPTPDCEMLHREAPESEPSPELTETQYLGFNIPEEEIHGLCYIWHHANLGTVTGGAWAWQGVKRHTVASELFDMRMFMDDSCLSSDFRDTELPNGYRSKVIEPMQKLEISYSDPNRGNSIEVEYEAMMPAMVMSTGFHFEQGMKTNGTVTLRGKEYEMRDCYTVRDRSWGQVRSEAPLLNAPPFAWMTGVFGDDFAFGTTAFDSEDTDPEWKGILEIPGGDPCRGGWVYRDDEIVPVVSVTKRTHRNAETLFPESVEMTITDANDRSYELQGTILAAAPWSGWFNMSSVICLTRWECEGRVGHADTQEVQFTDYMHRFMGNMG